jgi:transposase
MQTQINKKIDFSGQDLFIGLDVHKKSWQVCVLSKNICLQSFSQPPSALLLHSYLTSHYTNANYHSAYEAGFCGYGNHRKLVALGIDNIVINPADIPRTNKDTLCKNDKRDSRMIAEALRSGLLKCIHIFDRQSEEFRGLFRSRLALAKDIRKTRGRIKSFLAYRDIEVPTEFVNNPKSLKYTMWLQNLNLADANAKFQLRQFTERLLFLLVL